MRKPIVYAHRGASAYAPENTMPSYILANEMKADGIEIDVHLTIDGKMIVIHDDEISRISNGSGLIKDLTLSQILSFDFGSWKGSEFAGTKAPLLDEVLRFIKEKSMLLNIELKSFQNVNIIDLNKKVVSLIDEYHCADQIIISSFDHLLLKELKESYPYIKTGLLYGDPIPNTSDYVKKHLADAIHPYSKTVTAELAKECHDYGIIINAWTVDDETEMLRLIDLGADGIISNVPDKVRRIVDKI